MTKNHHERICAETYDLGYANGKANGLKQGKEEALKEAAEKYKTRDTLLKAAEVQTAAMECLTRVVATITGKNIY